MALNDLRPSGGGGGAVASVNGQTGVVTLDNTDIGLGNVDNTSDANKPVSTATQTALDLKQDEISAANRQLLWQNDSGDIEGLPNYAIGALDGLSQSNAVAPNAGGFETVHSLNMSIAPLQSSPNVGYNYWSLNAGSDSAAFDFGTAGSAIHMINNTYSHVNDQDIGEIAFINNYFQLGNGVDAIDANGFSYNYGFGDVAATTNITAQMQGYGFQPTFANGSTVDTTSASVTAFYDALSAPNTTFGNYTSASFSPTILGVDNNRNYSGVSINPNITNFNGNSSCTGLGISGNYGALTTGNFQGISINPVVTSGPYGAGININTASMGTTSTFAIDAVGDIRVTGDYSQVGDTNINGSLVAGLTNVGGSVNPVDGGGVPSNVNSVTGGVTALNGVTVANADTIGTAINLNVNLEDNSVSTSGAFGLGFAAQTNTLLVDTRTGSTLDNISASTAALNLLGSSTGGTIDTVKLYNAAAIPNGITTINKLRGFTFDMPFGTVGTVVHGFYNPSDSENYFKQSLVVGEDAEVRANSSVGIEINSATKALLNARMTTVERDALTPLDGMQVYNETLDAVDVRANGAWTSLATVSSVAAKANPLAASAEAASFTAAFDNVHIIADGSGAVVVTLPAVAVGSLYIKTLSDDISTDTVTVNTPLAETIDGAASYSFSSEKESIHLFCDGTNWVIL